MRKDRFGRELWHGKKRAIHTVAPDGVTENLFEGCKMLPVVVLYKRRKPPHSLKSGV
ncbi:hypothetical protein BWQ96_01264 [Gracilariopsis chorda]|uniref:Uncharacterized protein n=1 Tax=Gracilariopsis chorda TaxID=448386 RepID=A0A2V3J470_9FLOR|nr:hypothetical protein BWQ96_01264 [Gracilariopsis chorda]|eukprot:PXF48922.1 hypothetical protein BWQ96_01264 [Gracilariopsis chorda]